MKFIKVEQKKATNLFERKNTDLLSTLQFMVAATT